MLSGAGRQELKSMIARIMPKRAGRPAFFSVHAGDGSRLDGTHEQCALSRFTQPSERFEVGAEASLMRHLTGRGCMGDYPKYKHIKEVVNWGIE